MPGSQPLSSELSLPSGSRLPDNRRPCSASLAAFTTISPSPPAEVSGKVPAGKPRYGPSGLMSPFPVFGSPVVHGTMPVMGRPIGLTDNQQPAVSWVNNVQYGLGN